MITVRTAPGLAHLLPLSRGELRRALACMLESLGLDGHDVELALVSDADMAALNLDFLGCHGPTNVLSFPALDASWNGDEQADEGARQSLGELALAPQTVLREAFLYGQPLGRHTLWLLAHGIAHLAGHDHGPLMDALAEEAMQGALACLQEELGCEEQYS